MNDRCRYERFMRSVGLLLLGQCLVFAYFAWPMWSDAAAAGIAWAQANPQISASPGNTVALGARITVSIDPEPAGGWTLQWLHHRTNAPQWNDYAQSRYDAANNQWWDAVNGNEDYYVRGAYQLCDDCETQYTRIIHLTWGTGFAARDPPYPTPDGYMAVYPTFSTPSDLVDITPGGRWIAQMLVSVCAGAVVLVILRGSAMGLFAGVGTMPLAASMMAVLGYGETWFAAMTVILLILTVLAWAFVARR